MVEFANGQLPWRKIKDKEQVEHSHCLLDSLSASLVIGAFYMVNLVFKAFCTVNLVFGVFYTVDLVFGAFCTVNLVVDLSYGGLGCSGILHR